MFLGAQNKAILTRESNAAHETEVVFVVVNGSMGGVADGFHHGNGIVSVVVI